MSNFHILFVGYSSSTFSEIVCYIQKKCDYKISFITRTNCDAKILTDNSISPKSIYSLHDNLFNDKVEEGYSNLSCIVKDDVPTIHNMILGDRVVSRLPYENAKGYAERLTIKFEKLYSKIKPSVIIGCHDGVHSGIGCGVAKILNLPWFALSFCPIPSGYVALRSDIVPFKMECIREQTEENLIKLANELLIKFEKSQIKPISHLSSYNLWLTITRFPNQLKEGISRFRKTYFRGLNKYIEFSFLFIFKQYLRKRFNMLVLPKSWLLRDPPKKPFIFFGLHMQPETTIDVYAPFFSNQLNTIEIIARAIPPTHYLLVKLHISDADNYSRKTLKYIKNLPAVKLVAPDVSSKKFIYSSSAIITITGNMGLEGALLGKPVIIFGKKNYEHFPTVTRVGDIIELPDLVVRKLKEKKPSRDLIITAYAHYLKPYFKASDNNWKRLETLDEEKNGFVELFQALEKYINT